MKKLFLAVSLVPMLLCGVSDAFASSNKHDIPVRDSLVLTNSDGSVVTQYVAEPVSVTYHPGTPSVRPDLFTTDPLVTGIPSSENLRAPTTFPAPLSLPSGVNRSDFAVGQIPYTSGITPTGGRVYTVPIATIQDGKLAPKIALSYNSQSGNGIAGYGWSLTGLSSIMLTGKTLYYDGSSAAANLNAAGCVFSLDGARLVKSEGELSAGYQYETASGHIYVKSVVDGGEVCYFEALYPDGSKAVFGFRDNHQTRISYPLTSLTDRYGRVISVTYVKDTANGTYYPSVVRCIERGMTLAQITLSYDSRPDAVTSYYAGQKILCSKALTEIVSYVEGSKYLTYSLKYGYRNAVFELRAIECSNGGRHLTPLSFTYGDTHTGNGADFQKVSQDCLMHAFTNGNIRYIRGKFLSGNYSDGLIMLPIFSNYDEIASLKHWFKTYKQYGSKYSPEQHIVIAPCIGNSTDLYVKAEDGFQTIEALDVDDDGTDEIVKVNFTGIDGNYSRYRIKVYKFNESATKLDSTVIDTKFVGVVNDGDKLWSPQQRMYWFGKFDDRGGAQLLTVSFCHDFRGRDIPSYTSVVDLKTGQCHEYALFNLDFCGEVYYVVADIDGDGWTDLCRATSQGLERYKYNSGTFSLSSTLSGLTASTLENYCLYADVNGDGLLDIVTAPKSGGGNQWSFYAFTGGRSFVKRSYEICPQNDEEQFMFMDINKDGLADLLNVSGSRLNYYLNENGTISRNCLTSALTIPDGKGILPANTLNFNAISQFVVVDGFYVNGYRFPWNLSRDRLLTQFENSYGVVEQNSYEDMSVSASVYQKDYGRTYSLASGFSRRSFSANLISQTRVYSQSSSSELTENNYYTWYDAVYNSKGLGFCGFGKVRCIDYVNDIVSVQTYDPQKRGVLIGSTKALRRSMDSPFETTDNTYDSHSTTYGKLNPRLTKSVLTDNLTGLTTTTTMLYGDYDYPQSSVVRRQIGTGEVRTESTSYTYLHRVSESQYVLGSPLSRVVDRKKGEDNVRRSFWRDKTIFTYDDRLRPATKETYTGKAVRLAAVSPRPVAASTSTSSQAAASRFRVIDKTKLTSRTEWGYDDYDNVVSERMAHNGASEYLVKSWSYDETHRHVASATDVLGRVTKYADYNKFGQPEHIVNHHGDTTVVTYDSWGNRKETAAPDGNRVLTSLAFGGAGVYTVSEKSSVKPHVITHYDAWNRKVRVMTQCFDGKWRCVDYGYNNKGQLSRVSLPYRIANQEDEISEKRWTEYTYDDYGRKTCERYADGESASWSYSGSTIQENSKGISRGLTYDPLGSLVGIVEPNGKINYVLRCDGQPSSVTCDSVTTTFRYDAYGRRYRIIDPSAGTQTDTTVWNADGTALRTQTNPNGQIVSTMDKFGRITKIDRLGEYSTTYTYDDFGCLVSETSTNGTAKTYTYDRYDRVLTERETVPDGKWLQKSYAYGKGGQVNSIRYTSQTGDITTENYTWSNGINTGIVLSEGTVVMRLDEENDLGAPVRVTTGEVSRTYSFTTFGHPTGRKMDDGSIMDFEYAFQFPTGNLYVRQDNTRNLAESFTYDGLNRLTEMEGRKVTYTSYGNVTKVDGVGEMRYGNVPQKPYQITALVPEDDALVPSREQTVSYTCYGRPSRLVEGGKSASFTYNGSGDRVKMLYAEGVSPELTRYYIGGRYEQDIKSDGSSVERLYLGGDAYSAPMVLVRDGSGSWTALNIGRDYLGSITHIVTADGTLLAEYSYDPWGRLRDPETYEIYAPGTEPALYLGRGFTGHEHLPWFGLINMNARLYDPLLCRFLSPDPYVQAPDFTQSFNRYSYGLNNPLSYTDPNGEFWHLIIGAVFGGIANLIGNWQNCDGFWEYVAAFGIGAAAGLAVAATGGAAAAAGGTALATAGVIGVGAAGGASTGAVNDIIRQTGNNFDGMDSVNWKSVGVSAASGAVAGGISAGVGIGLSGSGIPISVNGSPVQSQLTKSFIIGALSGGAGHVAGGTTAGLLWGDSFKDAFVNSFDGLGSSMLMGGAYSATATFAYEMCVEYGADYFGITDEVNRIQNGESYQKTYRHDGTTYYNNDGQLPVGVTYKEYVVPPATGTGPGAARIVVGSDNQWYYTPDHYRTFYKFIP